MGTWDNVIWHDSPAIEVIHEFNVFWTNSLFLSCGFDFVSAMKEKKHKVNNTLVYYTVKDIHCNLITLWNPRISWVTEFAFSYFVASWSLDMVFKRLAEVFQMLVVSFGLYEVAKGLT